MRRNCWVLCSPPTGITIIPLSSNCSMSSGGILSGAAPTWITSNFMLLSGHPLRPSPSLMMILSSKGELQALMLPIEDATSSGTCSIPYIFAEGFDMIAMAKVRKPVPLPTSRTLLACWIEGARYYRAQACICGAEIVAPKPIEKGQSSQQGQRGTKYLRSTFKSVSQTI